MATTSNMGLTLPDVSVTLGPTWASQINSDLTLLDQHNHIPSANGGVPITSAALQIDGDVAFDTVFPAGVAATGLSYLGLLAPVGSLNVATRIYSDTAGDLYYDNAAGAAVRVTNGPNVAGTQGSITNLTSPAGANWNSLTSTFEWTSNANTGAGMDSGPVTIRDGSTGSYGVTLIPASDMAASYTLTFPSSAPASQTILTANAGVSSFAAVDSTLSLTSSLLRVANNGITSTQIASGAVGNQQLASNAVSTAKILDGAATQPKWGSKSFVYSPAVVSDSTSSVVPVQISNMAVSAVLRAGYSVRVELVPSLSGYSFIGMSTASAAPVTAFFEGEVVAPGPTTLNYQVLRLSIGNGTRVPVTSFSFIYLPTQNGLHTFRVYWEVPTGAETVSIENAKLVVFEQ